MKFKTAKDGLHGFFVWGFIFVLLGTLSVVLFSGEEISFVPVIILLALIGLLMSIWFGTSYTFEKEYLHVRFGVIREKIYYHEMTNVVSSNSLLSSYALSRQRLALYTNKKIRAYLSPEDQDRFILELEKHVDTSEFSF